MLIHWPCCFKSSFWKLSVGWMDKGLIEEKLLSNFSFLHHCHFLSSLILCYLEICRKSRKNWRSTKLKKTSGLKHISLNITNPQKRNGSTEQDGFQTIGWILKVWCKNLDTNWYQMGLSICLIIMDPIELCQKTHFGQSFFLYWWCWSLPFIYIFDPAYGFFEPGGLGSLSFFPCVYSILYLSCSNGRKVEIRIISFNYVAYCWRERFY